MNTKRKEIVKKQKKTTTAQIGSNFRIRGFNAGMLG
jgi:hypothetical protein